MATSLELILMRHAQAEPVAIDGDDFARPLTAPGREAAAHAAKRMPGAAIARILFSPAQRTVETAEIVAREWSLPALVMQPVPQMYLATCEVLRSAILLHSLASVGCILVVGHNPSISELAGELDQRLEQSPLHTAGFWRVRLELPTP